MNLRSVFWVGSAALAFVVTVSAVACSDENDPDPGPTDTGMMPDAEADAGVEMDGGVDPFAACRATITAKEAQFAAELVDWPTGDAPEMVRADGDPRLEADYAGRYRDDLANHVGCAARAEYGASTSEPFSTDNEAMIPPGTTATIAEYPCAAKAYTQTNEDTAKPIVILVHGNSAGVTSFEEYFRASLAGTTITNVAGFEVIVDTMVRQQLASKLVADGYRVIGFDARTDRVAELDDFDADPTTGNPFFNIDHGWIVPPLQALIKAVIRDNPNRQISLIGHSLGVTAIRDALRRLYVENQTATPTSVNPFSRLQDVILLSGANHGVSSGALLCPGGARVLANMRSTVTCEMGERGAFTPTYFTRRINGPNDLFSTPCADGDYAFGQRGVCGGNAVQYTTVTMMDIAEGSLQDEFVSEASSMLDNAGCVDNALIGLADFDSTGYFFTGAPGFLANHFGSARSEAGMDLILSKLAD
ncbi:MAG: alpha/beta hydrolase [Myxococcota bacterium]